MKEYLIENQLSNKLKWGLYSLLDIAIIIFILYFTEWHYLIKTVLVFSLSINLIFDLIYFRKEFNIITKISFDSDQIIISDNNNKQKIIAYSTLVYSIRKRKFESNKTEIELKIKKSFQNKTYGRLHIKNWTNILEIENQLESHNLLRVQWKPQTIWGKYWGIMLELLSIGIEQPLGGIALENQENTIIENTLNPTEEKNNA
jgi:hypothetical protein